MEATILDMTTELVETHGMFLGEGRANTEDYRSDHGLCPAKLRDVHQDNCPPIMVGLKRSTTYKFIFIGDL